MTEFHFLRPWWLLALLPTALLAWRLRVHADARRPWQKIVSSHLLSHLLVRGERQDRFRLRPWDLLLVAWVSATTALAGPTWRRDPAPFADDVTALAIVLKVTPSMESQDVQPTRLARATEKIRDLLKQRPGAKTALFAYAGSVHRVLPLTDDASIVMTFAEELSPAVMPMPGDVAAHALAAADETLRQSGQAASILWIADAVTAEQEPLLKQFNDESRTPVNMLAVSAAWPERASLEQAATALGASMTDVTVDDGDVRSLARHAEYSSVGDQSAGVHWRDTGYWLVPPVACVVLFWFRRGWTLEAGAH